MFPFEYSLFFSFLIFYFGFRFMYLFIFIKWDGTFFSAAVVIVTRSRESFFN